MQETKQHGGARPGAGRFHEHIQYILVDVVDFYGDRDVLIAGPVLLANGHESKGAMRRAESMAAFHVGEQARSVRIIKRWCCSHRPLDESEVIRVVK